MFVITVWSLNEIVGAIFELKSWKLKKVAFSVERFLSKTYCGVLCCQLTEIQNFNNCDFFILRYEIKHTHRRSQWIFPEKLKIKKFHVYNSFKLLHSRGKIMVNFSYNLFSLF